MVGILGEYRSLGGAAFWMLCAATAYFLVLAVRLAAVDAATHRLPNRIVLPAYPVSALLLGTAALAAGDAARIAAMVLAGVVLFSAYFLLRFSNPSGLGFGDVKLAGVLGLYLGFAGWPYVLAGTVAGFVLGGLWGVWLILSRRGTAKTAIAFGPFMLAGAALAMALPGLQ
ncbi:A24 family peptidase [Arthrobacter sp. zg-Y820]|uniref:prepilin peptidase n=1 Tax=unclassified Arthrobacter TaxID=235627 RepID=UPI001E2F63C8|nr:MULTISPECIES: A24 family peptidase [unclassified Arthrobacter]MCC9195562.1 A24 family peptidase [Arthrobacter sp. zg-Y820]MDK1278421.1 A24 family peptidase [Arthrobacter sp. zg.Y820]MDK1360110.1 A24 family peptidase [Arthrobacter sp. zg-Y1219]WIB11066.1 A24 family peptidase [Arthrobacter sp. zg-Y820]